MNMLSLIKSKSLLFSPNWIFESQCTISQVLKKGNIHRYFSSNMKNQNFDQQKKIEFMSHDDVYVVDTSLVIGYLKKEPWMMPWCSWVDEHKNKGKKIYILPRSLTELREELQSPFAVLQAPDWKPEGLMEKVFQEICSELKIGPKTRTKYKVDLKLVAEVGYAVASSPDLTDEDVLGDRVVFVSGNFKFIQRALSTPEKRKLFEMVIKENALEHMITTRCILSNGTYRDYNNSELTLNSAEIISKLLS